MQSENQENHWQGDNDSDTPTEMYTPESENDNPEILETKETKPRAQVDKNTVHWTASEYISQEKDGIWYLIFSAVVIILIAVDILIFKEYSFSILIVVMAISLIVFAKRPPRTLNYTLSGNQGLYIDDNLHHFSEFKAFGLLKEHGVHTIVLIPTKRFSPSVSVYFGEEDGEKIVDILGNRLPMEQLKLDIIDTIVQKIRL